MYRTFDEEIFLAPESIVSGVVAASAFDDDLEFPDVESLEPAREMVDTSGDADGDAEPDGEAKTHPLASPTTTATMRDARNAGDGDAWSRHAFIANGFGG